MNSKMIFSEHTEKYTSGLPQGDGRIAAMVLGTPGKTRFALNHEGLWRTKGRTRPVPTRSDRLPEIRRLIDEEKYEEATVLCHDTYSRYEEGSYRRNMPYVPAGDLWLKIDTGDVSDYFRSLDLKSGEACISFKSEKCGNVKIRSFISLTDGFGVISVRTDNKTEIDLELSRAPDENCKYEVKRNGERTELWGVLDGELFFLVSAEHLRLSASEHIFTFGIDVSEDKSRLDVSLFFDGYDSLFEKHRLEFSRRLGNSDIELDIPALDDTTDKRLMAFREGRDVTFPLLFFNFGKYLMVSGSGTLPHNLQGKWNEEIVPPWECDYHLDINLQMNYWFTDALGMGYANKALFDWCESCIPHGREMARNFYDCRGICFGGSTDLWGAMFHDAYGWNGMISSAPWLAQHFYRHYLYTGDVDFLREHAYPFLRECCEFYEDFTTEKEGRLVIYPSCSPENRFVGAGDLPISFATDSAMDISLYREVLMYADEASRILGVDEGRWSALLDKSPMLKIGSDGRLLEWDKEYAEAEPEHRHISHLVGYYPGWLVEKDSELEEACERSLDFRLSFGGGQTGWSRSWVSCIYARLGRSEKLWESIKNLICEQCSPSLLDFHPPMGNYKERIFQIDGNFGGTAAICESMVSVRFDEAELLSACPEAWKKGSVSHFRLPYDTDISFDFEDGRVTHIELTSGIAHELVLIFNGERHKITLEKNNTVMLGD